MAERNGSSTSEIFAGSPASDKTQAVLDRIADPTRSHFFNTDCVSCHTETRRAMELLNLTTAPGIDKNVLPNGPWNVRNFGWSPEIEGTPRGTVTRRTAAETAAVTPAASVAIAPTNMSTRLNWSFPWALGRTLHREPERVHRPKRGT